jgi:hypothetical protein
MNECLPYGLHRTDSTECHLGVGFMMNDQVQTTKKVGAMNAASESTPNKTISKPLGNPSKFYDKRRSKEGSSHESTDISRQGIYLTRI